MSVNIWRRYGQECTDMLFDTEHKKRKILPEP